MTTDWVKRKAIGEQFIEEHKERVWQDLCQALASAVESFSIHYGGSAHGQFEGDRRFHIHVGAQPGYEEANIDVTFVPPEIRITCRRGHCKASTYLLNPNKDSPFRNSDKQVFTVEQLSEAILRSVFFPAETRGVRTPITSPCTSVM